MKNLNLLPSEPNWFKNKLAGIITIFSLFLIVLFFIFPFYAKPNINEIKQIIGMLLPVIAGWVSAVIAFYYSKENLEIANKNINDLVDKINPMEKLKSILAKDAMIPFNKMEKMITDDKLTAKKIQLLSIIDFCTSKGIARVPIVDNNNILIYLIHRSMVDLIIAKFSIKSVQDKNINLLTVLEILDDEETKIYIKAQISIKEDATLLDAKSAYDNEPNSQDVFITKNGSITEPILGWITQNEIIKYLSK